MKILNIIYLNEGREDYALQTFGTTIENVMKSDRSNKMNSPKNVIAEFNRIDPKSLVWLCRMYCKQNFLIEDLPRLKDVIKSFYDNRNKLELKDINQYKQISDLEDAVEAVSDALPASVNSRPAPSSDEYKIVVNDGDFKVLTPHSKAASQYFGVNTKWCTARTDNHCMFSEYNDDGPLYIVIDGKTKYQYHFGERSFTFMNAKDQPLDFFEIERLLKKSTDFAKMFKQQIIYMSEQYEGQGGRIYGPLYLVAELLTDNNSFSSEEYKQALNFLDFIFDIPLAFDEVDLNKLNADCRLDKFFDEIPEIMHLIMEERSREVYDILVKTGNIVGAVTLYRYLEHVPETLVLNLILDNYSKLSKFITNNPREFQQRFEQIFSRYMDEEPTGIINAIEKLKRIDSQLLEAMIPHLFRAATYYYGHAPDKNKTIYRTVLKYLESMQ